MTLQIRPVSVEEVEAFQRSLGIPFGFDPTPEMFDRFRNAFEFDRLRAAVDGGQIVGTFGALTLRMTVPANLLSAAGTTVITVLPTHRRQGVLRTLMTAHLTEVHERGEPLAGLWASESSIYGRFGYGPACERVIARLEKPYARMHEPVDIGGSMRLIEREEAQKLFPPIYDVVAAGRPGMLARSENWWRHRVLSDNEYMRRGGTTHRRVVHLRDGRPVGYAIYRTRTEHPMGATEVQVLELVGIDPPSEKALWQFLFGIDLSSSITQWNQPVDHPLLWWLEQPRRLERKVEDSLWLRPVDVGAALEGRRYSTAGTLSLRVHDHLCPWNEGVWRLDVDKDGTARCRKADSDAELELTSSALGMVYLGGHRFRALACSGLIQGSADALRRADALFTWDPLPWCQELF